MAFSYANTTTPANRHGYPAVPLTGLTQWSLVVHMSMNSATAAWASSITQYVSGTAQFTLQRNSTTQSLQLNVDGDTTTVLFAANGVLRKLIITYDSTIPEAKAYIDGAPIADPTGLTTGALATNAGTMHIGYQTNGTIVEVAIYNRVLTAAEAAAHGDGASCLAFPSGLIFYAPQIRSPVDLVGGGSATVTGSPTVVEHQRIYL